MKGLPCKATCVRGLRPLRDGYRKPWTIGSVTKLKAVSVSTTTLLWEVRLAVKGAMDPSQIDGDRAKTL